MPWIPPSPGQAYVRGPAYWPLRIAETFGGDPLAWVERWDELGHAPRALLMAYAVVREWERRQEHAPL